MKKSIYFFRKLSASICLCVLLLLPVIAVYARSHTTGIGAPNSGAGTGVGAPNSGSFIENPLRDGTNSIYALVELIVTDIVVPLGSVVVVLMIIYSGFLFVTAQGNETKISDAKMTFFYAVIGAAILFGAWAIAGVIESTVEQVTGEQVN